MKKLISIGEYFVKDGYFFKTRSWGNEAKFNMVANMKSTQHGVLVVGQPKTGNHLCMSMLDMLGCDRAEEIGDPNGINTQPFEDQPNIEAYARMEQKMEDARKYTILPHAHIQAQYFPTTFHGKIIHVTRDPRAVAVSGYPFFGSIPHWRPYFDVWGFANVNDWARHDVEGHFYNGDIDDYDAQWRKIAKERNYDILFITFEDIVSNKEETIRKVAQFLGIADYKMSDVVNGMSLAATVARRQAKFDAAGVDFRERRCYRTGQIGSWREELSDEMKAAYRAKYPRLGE